MGEEEGTRGRREITRERWRRAKETKTFRFCWKIQARVHRLNLLLETLWSCKVIRPFVRLRFGPAELSQELLVRSLGRRRIRQRYRARRVFSDRVEHNHGKFVAE